MFPNLPFEGALLQLFTAQLASLGIAPSLAAATAKTLLGLVDNVVGGVDPETLFTGPLLRAKEFDVKALQEGLLAEARVPLHDDRDDR